MIRQSNFKEEKQHHNETYRYYLPIQGADEHFLWFLLIKKERREVKKTKINAYSFE